MKNIPILISAVFLFLLTGTMRTFNIGQLNFSDFILEYNIPVIFILELIGLWFKKSQVIKDKYIPVWLVGIGWIIIFFYMIINESADLMTWQLTGYFIVNAFVQAVFVAGAAVLGNQIYKQMKKKE